MNIYPIYAVGRKVKEENLQKIVSTKLAIEDFHFLETYCKQLYNSGIIEMPTVSHALRWAVKDLKNRLSNKHINPSKKTPENSQKFHRIIDHIDNVSRINNPARATNDF